jgi:hypothetical protein
MSRERANLKVWHGWLAMALVFAAVAVWILLTGCGGSDSSRWAWHDGRYFAVVDGRERQVAYLDDDGEVHCVGEDSPCSDPARARRMEEAHAPRGPRD